MLQPICLCPIQEETTLIVVPVAPSLAFQSPSPRSDPGNAGCCAYEDPCPRPYGDEQQATDKRQASRAQEVVLGPKTDKPGTDCGIDGENQDVADQYESNEGLAREPGVGVDRVGESEHESIGDGEAQHECSKD